MRPLTAFRPQCAHSANATPGRRRSVPDAPPRPAASPCQSSGSRGRALTAFCPLCICSAPFAPLTVRGAHRLPPRQQLFHVDPHRGRALPSALFASTLHLGPPLAGGGASRSLPPGWQPPHVHPWRREGGAHIPCVQQRERQRKRHGEVGIVPVGVVDGGFMGSGTLNTCGAARAAARLTAHMGADMDSDVRVIGGLLSRCIRAAEVECGIASDVSSCLIRHPASQLRQRACVHILP